MTVCLLVQSCLFNHSSSHNPEAPPIHSSPAPVFFSVGFVIFAKVVAGWIFIRHCGWSRHPAHHQNHRGKLFCNIQIINMYLYLRLFCINVKSCHLHGVLDMCVYVVLPHWKTTIVLYQKENWMSSHIYSAVNQSCRPISSTRLVSVVFNVTLVQWLFGCSEMISSQ